MQVIPLSAVDVLLNDGFQARALGQRLALCCMHARLHSRLGYALSPLLAAFDCWRCSCLRWLRCCLLGFIGLRLTYGSLVNWALICYVIYSC